MDLQLNSHVALVVGGAGSIGAAVRHLLAAEGARVVCADRQQVLDSLPGQTDAVPIDVTDESSVRAAIQAVVARHGRIDVLVMLAAVYHGGPVASLAVEDWDRVLAINLKGTFLTCREVLPVMQRRGYGRIVCLASLAGQVGGLVAGADYAASKAGVLSLVKSLARQARLAPPASDSGDPPLGGGDGSQVDITVNAVSPGPVDSAMTASWSPAERQAMMAKIPLGRFAQPEEIAYVVALLASPRAGYIHGARIDVNGGAWMG
jgi:3-oxoacyl-[acyl-carrier protein] reductase